MKKIILLIAAALFLVAGNNSVTAQAKMKKETQSIDTEKIEVQAQKKTKSLVRALNLSDEQQEEIYGLFAKTEKKIQSASISSDVNSEEMKDKKAKMDEFIKQKMKDILDEEQFAKYLELSKKL